MGKPVEVLGISMDGGTEPLMLLREREAPHRVLPISIGEPEAVAIAVAMRGEAPPPRPLTHDLLAALLDNLDARVDHVEVTEVRGGTFHAQLSLQGRDGNVTIDSRPSDAVALALRVEAPVFASDQVLDEAGAVLSIVDRDDTVIDETVQQFRSFLDQVDPTAFAGDEDGDGDEDEPDPGAPGESRDDDR